MDFMEIPFFIYKNIFNNNTFDINIYFVETYNTFSYKSVFF